MKSQLDAILQCEQALYLERLTPPCDPIFAEMEAYSESHHIPSSDPEVAIFLELMAKALQARRAIEIGTAIGYGAITPARAMGEDGRVTTIDPSAERAQLARDFMRRAGVEARIEIIQAAADSALRRRPGGRNQTLKTIKPVLKW